MAHLLRQQLVEVSLSRGSDRSRDSQKEIVGATIVCEGAGEMLSEITLLDGIIAEVY